MGWSKEWPEFKQSEKHTMIYEGSNPFPEINHVQLGIDLGSGDSQTILTTWENGEIKHRVIPPEELYVNAKPTHDPYANPNAHIYYECNCGAILDPKTKSFAQLNNHASAVGWKIRFGEHGYTPYCVKCGENVE
jgi:hypothetical protein